MLTVRFALDLYFDFDKGKGQVKSSSAAAAAAAAAAACLPAAAAARVKRTVEFRNGSQPAESTYDQRFEVNFWS